jgi:NAD(P)-dependent dehydrogenase (short-subunit alcohol dehydrogenase family)
MAMSEANKAVAVVVGIGPGLGAAAARRFARGGFAVALVARGEEKLVPVKAEIEEAGGVARGFACDTTDAAAVKGAFARIREELGAPSVLVYNAGAFQMGGILEFTAEEFERCWRANCLGGLITAREVLPAMLEKGAGTIVFTGATASLRGGARFACLAVGKFGLRALAQSMARELGPRGIHVAHVVIDGQIDSERARRMFPQREAATMLSPDAIAETYWHLHTQPASAWTHELELRPATEKF